MSKKKAVVTTEVSFPEVGTIEEQSLRKLYKKLTDAQLDEWVGLEGLTYKESEHEPINRMRKCMAITALHFPKQAATKKASKYSDYTTEKLVEMCMDNDLVLRDDKGDQRILRMYAIMELRKAGVIA